MKNEVNNGEGNNSTSAIGRFYDRIKFNRSNSNTSTNTRRSDGKISLKHWDIIENVQQFFKVKFGLKKKLSISTKYSFKFQNGEPFKN